MPGPYYILNCEDPDEGYLARLSYTPDAPRRSWILGERFAVAPPEPVRATIRGLDDDDTVMAELWKSPVPAFSSPFGRPVFRISTSTLRRCRTLRRARSTTSSLPST